MFFIIWQDSAQGIKRQNFNLPLVYSAVICPRWRKVVSFTILGPSPCRFASVPRRGKTFKKVRQILFQHPAAVIGYGAIKCLADLFQGDGDLTVCFRMLTGVFHQVLKCLCQPPFAAVDGAVPCGDDFLIQSQMLKLTPILLDHRTNSALLNGKFIIIRAQLFRSKKATDHCFHPLDLTSFLFHVRVFIHFHKQP